MATLKLGKEPGVYVQEELNPALSITEARLKVAGLVGHAPQTIRVSNIEVVRSTSGSTDTLEDYQSAYVESVLCVSDYLNAYGSNLPQYVQLTAEQPTEPRPTEVVPAPGDEPVEPVAPVNPGPDATPEEQAQYQEDLAQYEADHAEWVVADAAWQEANAAYIEYTELVAAWAAYDAAVAEADYKVEGNVITWLRDVEGSQPVAGARYYVTAVIKKDESYYEPKLFADIDAVKAFYGPEYYVTDGGTAVMNEITVGARIMFNNGADEIWICEAKPDAQGQPVVSNVKKAIDLLSEPDIQSLVVLYQTAEIQRYIMNHVVTMSTTENQHERVGFICALDDSPDAIATQCASFKEQRIINVVPSKVTVLAEDAEGIAQEFEVSSTFAAAAAVGLLTNNARLVSEPLTRKTLTGVYGLSKKYTRPEIEKMSAAGAFILKESGNYVVVNQSVTTDNTNQNNRELSVVLIKDEVLKDIRYNLDRDYIGHSYNRKTTPTKIKTSIINILNTYLDTLIEGYDEGNIVVAADEYDTTRVNVKMSFAVLRPLNYIYISFMVTL